MISPIFTSLAHRTLHTTAALAALLLLPIGHCHAEVLANTVRDFSAASLPANAWPSAAGQAGFYYGRYIGADSTSGSFDTAQMSVGADPRGGGRLGMGATASSRPRSGRISSIRVGSPCFRHPCAATS